MILSFSLSSKAEKLHSPIPPKLAVFVASMVISYSVASKEVVRNKKKKERL